MSMEIKFYFIKQTNKKPKTFENAWQKLARGDATGLARALTDQLTDRKLAGNPLHWQMAPGRLRISKGYANGSKFPPLLRQAAHKFLLLPG